MTRTQKTPELLERWRREIPELEKAIPELSGKERAAAQLKLYHRLREFGRIPAEMTISQFRAALRENGREEKLRACREELEELLQVYAAAKGHKFRASLRAKIRTRKIALGLAEPRKKHPDPAKRKKTPEERIPDENATWHFEDPADYAPACIDREPGERHSPAGWRTTDNWRYVNCPKCLALRQETEGKTS